MGFWKGQKVLVTGGKGFLGRHLTEQLEAAGASVFAPSHGEYALDTPEGARAVFRKVKPEYVFHAAADVGGIGYNRIAPADIFRNNLLMHLFVFEAAREFQPKKLILIGSACAYPGHVEGVLREEDFEAGAMHESVEMYGFSKRALHLGGKAYRQQYGLNSIFLLLTNLYGPYDKYDPKESHVVAALIRKFVEAKRAGDPEVVCWGTGKPIREFMFAPDCAKCILLAGEKYEDPKPLNIGTGIGTTIRELAETLKAVSGYEGSIIWDSTKPDGAMKKILDVGRLKTELNFKNCESLEKGIKKTLLWYRKFFK